MTNVTSFSAEESETINSAKKELESIINTAEIYGYRHYDLKNSSLEKRILVDDRINMVIAGGIIPAILNKDYIGPVNTVSVISGSPSDIDVFILNMDISLFKLMTNLKTGPWIVKYFFDDTEDDRNEDYKNPHVFATATNRVSNVQYILTDHKNRKELLDDFDFLHCTASYYDGKLFINRETYDCIMKKQLVRVNKNKTPKQWRVEKFRQRGWKSEIDTMMETPSRTLKDILQDKLDNLRSPQPVDPWANAARKTNWIDDAVTKTMMDAISKGRDTYSTTSLEDEMKELLGDPYLQTK